MTPCLPSHLLVYYFCPPFLLPYCYSPYRLPAAEKVLQRGEKIELLVDKTEALSQSARRFQHQSKSLKNVMWCVINFKLIYLTNVMWCVINHSLLL